MGIFRRLFGERHEGFAEPRDEDAFELPASTDPKIGLIASRDCRQLAYAKQDSSEVSVYVNGRRMGRFDEVGGLTFSKDSKRLAFAAKAEDRWYAVMDDAKFGPWDAIGGSSPVISPDNLHIAYSAKRGRDWYAVVDGDIHSGPYEGFGVGGPVFSEDSTRLIYVVKSAASFAAIVDGKSLAAYPSIIQRSHCFSPDSKVAAFSATVKAADTQNSSFGEDALVLNGEVERTWRRDRGFGLMGEVYFSPNSQRHAYGVKKGEKSLVVIDGEPQTEYSGLTSAWFGAPNWTKFPDYGKATCKSEFIVFSPDSKQCAYGAVNDGEGQLIVEGKTRARHRILNMPIAFSPDASRLALGIQTEFRQAVVVDGRPSRGYHGMAGCRIAFSPNSRSVGFVASDASGQYLLVLNGNEIAMSGGPVIGAHILWDDDSHIHTMVADGRLIRIVAWDVA